MARCEKVAQALKEEVSNIIQVELHDPRLGFLTITRVDLTADLRYARIYFSVLGQDEDYQRSQQVLDSASGFIRRLIGQRVRLRFVPEIIFKEDRSFQYSMEIEQALVKIKEEDESKKSRRRNKKA